MLQILMPGVGQNLAHALHILTGDVGEQALKVMPGVDGPLAGLGAEEIGDHRSGSGEALGQGGDTAVFIF